MESNVIYTFPQLIRLRSAFFYPLVMSVCVFCPGIHTFTFFLFVLIVVYTFLD